MSLLAICVFVFQIYEAVAMNLARCGPPGLAIGSTDSPSPSPITDSVEPYYGQDYMLFDVTNYGAVGDGETDSSLEFMAAWEDACANAGNSILYIPEGTFFVGPVSFAGPCYNNSSPHVLIIGNLKAPGSLKPFADSDWIQFRRLNGLSITGQTGAAKLDGQGAKAWSNDDCHKHDKCPILPTSLRFSNVSNGCVSNISLVNSKGFHFGLHGCNNVNISSMYITAPSDSPNTDGIHISLSTNITITSSTIGVGDDCVSIGPGTTNIFVSHVKCGPGHGISIGSLGKRPDEKDVLGIRVENCTIKGTDNGIRIKTWPGAPPSNASDLIFKNIAMENVSNPIIIDQDYCPSDSCTTHKGSGVKLKDIYIKNITGTYNSESAVMILCSSVAPCEDILIFDVNLRYIIPVESQTSRFNVKGGVYGLTVLNSTF